MQFRIITLAAILISVCLGAACSRVAADSTAIAPQTSSDPKIADAHAFIDKMPDSPRPYLHLATLYIQKARSTGDFGLYAKATTAVDKAAEIDANDLGARKLKASLHLTYHRFDEALVAGNALLKEMPSDPFVFGVISDANAELGNYDEAVKTAQRMVDLKPNSSAYSRVAHLRSLYGDHKGSVEMYTLAARTADPNDAEAQSWCLTQLGDEHWRHGEFDRALKIYDEALAVFPDYYLALVSKGRLLAAKGETAAAIDMLTKVNDRVPNLEASIWLGDLYTKTGETEQAKRQYALADAIDAKTGVNNDQKRLALLWANNNVRIDEALVIVNREYALRKDILTADALSWVLYRAGRFAEAKKASTEARRLKTNDATMLYHAGIIEHALGNDRDAAKLIGEALNANPMFDLLQSDAARTTLASLKGGVTR